MVSKKVFINDLLTLGYDESLKGFVLCCEDYEQEQDLLEKESKYLRNCFDKLSFKLIKYKKSKALFFESSRKLLPLSSFMGSKESFFKLAINICEQLEKLHQKNILHGNLTLNSIFVDEDFNIYIFGFSNAISYHKNSTGISHVFFKNLPLEQKSPEQLGRINSEVDLRSDIYTLGLIFYKLLMQEEAFKGSDELETLHLILTKEINSLEETSSSLSNLVVRCLKKSVLQRYQSLNGLLYDLKQLQKDEKKSFILGSHDLSSRLQFPQKVYGRQRELEFLKNAYSEVEKGLNKTIFISGYSGIGKSSLIEELKNRVVGSNCYFISSKFDQYNKNLPYFAIKEAFTFLVEKLLTKDDKSLENIKNSLLKVLGGNGKVLIDIVPKLEQILGKQPEVQQLPANESENRFNNVFISFIKTVATKQNPLVLVVDDLQWMDLATLKLLESIINENSLEYVFILAAYRNNEIEGNLPLKNIIDNNKKIEHLHLLALTKESLLKFLEDTLFLSKEELKPLLEEVYKKTAANPFFFKQFIEKLYDDNFIFFDFKDLTWKYDINKIKEQNLSDNVASFMLSRIDFLDEESLYYLQIASCLGSTFDLKVLQKVSQEPIEHIIFKMQEVFSIGFLIPLEIDINSFNEVKNSDSLKIKFLHDQVQQAVYSTIEQNELLAFHYRIGKILLKEESLNYFEILSHLNFSKQLIKEKKEKFELMELNMHAMNLAKKSTAFDNALVYLIHAKELLESFDLKRYHSSYINILIEYVELAYLTAAFDKAKRYEKKLFKIITSLDDEIRLRRVLTVQYTRVGRLDEAIAEAIKSLNLLGHKISKDISFEDVQEEIKEVQVLLRKTPFRKVVTLEKIEDENILKILDILMEMQPCAYNSGSLVFPITILRLLKLTILHGNSYLSYYIYMMYALMNTKVLKDYKTAFEASKYAKQIEKEYGKSILTGRVNMMFANFVLPWQNGLLQSSSLRKQAFNECLEFGDYYWGIHSYIFGFYANLLISKDVDELYKTTKNVATTSKEVKQISQYYVCNVQMNLISILNGSLENRNDLNHEKGFETKILKEYETQNYMCGKYDFIIARLLQGFFFENYQQALDVSLAQDIDASSLDEGIFHEAFYKVFNILAILLLDIEDKIGEKNKKRYDEYLKENLPFIDIWKENSPDVFMPLAFLIEALKAQKENSIDKTMVCFEKSIELSASSNTIFLQALCNELYGNFWLKRENKKIAVLYLKEAISFYNSWKAFAKVKFLEQKIASLGFEQKAKKVEESLDLNLIIKSSNIISKEVKLETLIEKIMQILSKFSGAQNGYIFLSNEMKLIARMNEDNFTYTLNKKIKKLVTPTSVISYVKRTKQILLQNDVLLSKLDFEDEYMHKYNPKALFAIPLILNDEVKGVIYLDNCEQKNIFLEQNVQMIKLLLSQMIISIENAYFYENLESLVEQKTKDLQNTLALFDMGEMVLFNWKNAQNWPILYVSNNVKELLGYDKEEFLSGKLKYEELIHKEDKEETIKELLEATKNKKEKIEHKKYRLKHKLGHYLWIYDVTKIIYNNKGEATDYLGCLVDVTKEKEREYSLFQQTKMVALSEMMSNIAHQWRQPLNVISTSISSLKVKKELDVLEENDIERTSDVVIETVQNLSQTIDDFKSFLSANKSMVDFYNLSSLIKKAYNMINHSLELNGIEVVFEMDENLKVNCSENQLIQVFVNILTNAKDALVLSEEKEKLVFVSLEKEKDEVCIKIKDSAGGISSKIIGKIFEPYFTTKHQSQGTGLGLYLTHQTVANELKGRIKVTNEEFEYKGSFYKGACFEVCLKSDLNS